MHSNIQPSCDFVVYEKYKKFYDKSMAFERSLFWDFAEYLLVCLISSIVLFFLFAIYVRVRKINGTLPMKEKASVFTPTQPRRRRVATNKMSRSSSAVAIYQRDSVSSTTSSDSSISTSDSSFDSSCRSDESSSDARSRSRPSFMPIRRSFVKMVGTIKDLPQKVQDEVPIPSFARRISGSKMKRSLSTSQLSHVTTPIATSLYSSTETDSNSSVSTSSTTSNSDDDRKPLSILIDSRRDLSLSPGDSSATTVIMPADSSSARESPDLAQECSSPPSTPRRPTLRFAKSMLDITTSKGPRSPSLRLPPLPRRSSAKSSLCMHVEDHEVEAGEV